MRIKERIRNKLLSRLLPGGYYFRIYGYCPCCQKEAFFHSENPWLRDHFHCQHCRSIPRQRALLHVLQKHYPDWRSLRIHESSPSGGGASARLRSDCSHYVQTQYFQNQPPGVQVGAYRNENLEAQTFPDEEFDLVITQDVMEHVYDPAAAFREIARTLRPGGAHVFSVPLINKHKATEVWATRSDNGSPRFLQTPEYHGNPIDPQGSPVTMHWGFDIAAFIQEASGMQTEIEYTRDLKYGIEAEYIEILVSKKPAG